MRYCLVCKENAQTHHKYAHLCVCRNPLCPEYLHSRRGGWRANVKKPSVRRSEKINTAKGTKELSQMIADVLAHYEFKRRYAL